CVAMLSCLGRSTARSGALQTGAVPVCGGPGSATHRSAALALHRIRDTQAPDAFVALFTFQTTHPLPPARSGPRGSQPWFTHPESRGGRSADPPPVHPHVASGCPRLLQELGLLLLSCAAPTSPLPSSGNVVLDRDRA